MVMYIIRNSLGGWITGKIFITRSMESTKAGRATLHGETWLSLCLAG